MKVFISLASLFLLLLAVSCSTHKERAAHSLHGNGQCSLKEGCKQEECKGQNICEMYEKKCAYSVSKGDIDTEGKDQYSLEHKGHNYFFSNEQRMEEFKKNIDKNIERANSNWIQQIEVGGSRW